MGKKMRGNFIYKNGEGVEELFDGHSTGGEHKSKPADSSKTLKPSEGNKNIPTVLSDYNLYSVGENTFFINKNFALAEESLTDVLFTLGEHNVYGVGENTFFMNKDFAIAENIFVPKNHTND